jgi:hypothetical protein
MQPIGAAVKSLMGSLTANAEGFAHDRPRCVVKLPRRDDLGSRNSLSAAPQMSSRDRPGEVWLTVERGKVCQAFGERCDSRFDRRTHRPVLR